MTDIRIRTQQQRSRSFKKILRGATAVGAVCAMGFGTNALVKRIIEDRRYDRAQALIEAADIENAGTMIERYEYDNALPAERIAQLRQEQARITGEIAKRTEALCTAYSTNDVPSIERLTKDIVSNDKIAEQALRHLREYRCSPMQEEDLIKKINLVIGEGRIALIEEFLTQYPNSAYVERLRDDAAITYLSIGRSYFHEHVAPGEVVRYLGKFHRFIVTQRPTIPADRLSELVKEGHAYVHSDVPAESPGTAAVPIPLAEATPSTQGGTMPHTRAPDMDPRVYARWQQARAQRNAAPDNLPRAVPSPSLRAQIVQHLDAIEYAASRD